ncbi:MAG: 1-acyl-sn-glycerol-3-phosphate acyltransferase [Deltaproteobacteria bacterium]|nr:1-acyl-sn-glycerol-3-phosphate acyltransferase [Deltaproteobacteria bacterium]
MLRTCLLNGFIGLHTLVFCALALPLALFDRNGRLIHRWIAVPWAGIIVRVCGVRVDVLGRENIDAAKPRIYLTNHQSFFDIFVLLARLPVEFKFVLKQELMRIPVLGFTMRRARYIAIDRENPRKAVQSMNEAAERIKAGVSVVVFPEGTRSEDGRLQSFKRGGFLLALKSGCELVPVTIQGSSRVAPKGSLRIRPGGITMTIGEAFPLEGYNKRNVDRLMERIHKAMRLQMGEQE